MSILRPKFSTSGYFKKKRKPNKKKDSINLNESNDSEIINQAPKARRTKGKKGFRGTKIFNFIKIANKRRKKKKELDAPAQIENLEAVAGATGDDFIQDKDGGVELRPVKEIKPPKQLGKDPDSPKLAVKSFNLKDDQEMSWWGEISDLDRLNILSAPIEDRARLLSSKTSGTVEETMETISQRSGISYLPTFDIADNPTKLIPLRLIHSFSCLPIKKIRKVLPEKLKILCVDDDDAILKGLNLHLGRDFDILTAENGLKGLEVFREHQDIAICLSDMRMPEMDGAKMVATIKELQPRVQTLLLTGHSDFNLVQEAVNDGGVHKILTKPVSPALLKTALNECADLYARSIEEYNEEEENEGQVSLLTVWPPNKRMDQWIHAVSGRMPIWHLGNPEKVARAITENFGIGADSLDDSDLELEEEDQQDDIEDQNAAIIRFVNEVIQRAIVDRATDIHFEPHKETLQIRYRIDGQLVPVRVPDNLRSFQDAIISRIKIMAGINISEKRRPQGGRITFNQGKSDLDIRVSTLPTLYGESISLRLLNEKSQPLSMRELGLQSIDEKKIGLVLEKPHGIVLVTGPTGSGKSTSLTAFIRKIHKPERRIMTVEDPVEYEVSGVNQTQVNSEIGFSFASALREILRQDPDVIMVGEIRDRETADIAIRASLTGHLVLSTLHTNDAPGAITRLIDMDIEPFLISSSVEMVIAQRLVRRLCSSCAQSGTVEESDLKSALAMLGIDPTEMIHQEKVFQAIGCERCQNLGFRGRVGIFELMRMSDSIQSMIIKNSSAPEIRQLALSEGMTTLQQSGWIQVKRGLTSLSEVIRYADIFTEEEEIES
jgi:general secretion pathway protein E